MNTLLWILVLLASMVICGALSSYLAQKKGHNAGAWFVCGFFFDIFGLIAAAGLPMVKTPDVSEELKKCPDCAEMVRSEAKVCPHCGHRFVVPPIV